jgi:hypothetical protein
MSSELSKGSHSERRFNERGQAMVLVLLALGLFLVAAVGFAVDFANCWFHRQSAQGAADAACSAGAMDMTTLEQGGSTLNPHFTPGTSFDCAGTTPNSVTTSPTPCWYAATNGYASPGLTSGAASNDVAVSFPGSVSGITAPTNISSPFMRVDIVDRVQVYFSGLLTGSKTQDVRAFSVCGIISKGPPSPILVLNPSVSGALALEPVQTSEGTAGGQTGYASLFVEGGATQSLQVNSNSSTAVVLSGSGESSILNLCAGGTTYCGSNIGIFGPEASSSQFGFVTSCGSSRPTLAPSCSATQVTPQWITPSSTVADPWANLAIPSSSGLTTYGTSGTAVAAGVDGCPTTTTSSSSSSPSAATGCNEFSPGFYPNGIDAEPNTLAMFRPGFYYVEQGLGLDNQACMFPANHAGDDWSQGTTFFFSNANYTLNPDLSQTWSADNDTSSEACLTAFPNGMPVSVAQWGCPGIQMPSNITALYGNVFLGPCNTSNVYSESYSGTQVERGLVFFQDRTAITAYMPTFGGGRAFTIVGSMYFHNCNSSGTGTNCSSSAYVDNVAFGGIGAGMGGTDNTTGGCTATQSTSTICSTVFGTVVADQLSVQGNYSLYVILNPMTTLTTLKVSLLR